MRLHALCGTKLLRIADLHNILGFYIFAVEGVVYILDCTL